MKTKAEWVLDCNEARDAINAIEAKAQKEDRDLTDSEREQCQTLAATVESASEHIKKMEQDEQRRIKLDAIEAELKASHRLTVPAQPTDKPPESREEEPWETIARHGTMTAFKGPNAKRDAYLSGQWLLSKIAKPGTATHERAVKLCRNYGFISPEERVLATNNNTYGGFLVPTPLSNTIIELRETYGVFRQQARVYPMSSDVEMIPRYSSGSTAYYVTENSEITASTPSFSNVMLTARKLACLTKMSSEISEDAVIALSSWVADDFSRQFAYQEDLAGFMGDGSATYGGIQGVFIKLYTDSPAVGAIDCVTAAADSLSEVATDDLAQLVAKLPQYARPNAKWYCSATAKAVIFDALAMAASGNNVVDLGNGPVSAYWGYPIVVSQVCPASLTAGAYNNLVMVVLGDLRMSSTLGSRSDIRIQVLDQRYAEYDQIALRGTERFDIVNHNVGDATAAGPVVGLVGAS